MKIDQIVSELCSSDTIDRLQFILGKEQLEKLARESGFVQRVTSRLTGEMFLDLNVCYLPCNQERSLNDMGAYLEENYGFTIGKQALDERFNRRSVQFMRLIYEELLSALVYQSPISKGLESNFSAIKLIDATSFQLSEAFSSSYKGSGGSASCSAIKIHQVYELLKGELVDLHIGNGKDPDVLFWSQGQAPAQKNELWIADLGYFSLAHFEELMQAGAYFLSRYKTGTGVYLKNKLGDFEPLDLAAYLAQPLAEAQTLSVYLGKDSRIPVRLWIESVPASTKAKRLKKIRDKGKKWNQSALSEQLCGFNLFITNAPSVKLPSDQIRSIYSLRWQIELLFKVWKSVLEIDKLGKVSIYRFECYLYGCLIALLMTSSLQTLMREQILGHLDPEIELSDWKCFKILKKN